MQVQNANEERVAKLHELQEAQRESLERAIARTKCPPVKYSPKVLDAIVMERRMVQTGRYEEAQKWRERSVAQKKAEEEAHVQQFERKQQKRRDALKVRQEADAMAILEKNRGLEWKDRHSRELESALLDRNLRNLEADIVHAHKME